MLERMRVASARRAPHVAALLALATFVALGCAASEAALSGGDAPGGRALGREPPPPTAPTVPPAPPAPPAPVEAPSAPPAPPARRPGAYANLDPADDFVVGPPGELEDCEAQLARAGVSFRRAKLAVHTPKRSKVVCGAPQVVTYLKGPGGIAYSSPPLLTCEMALALASFERILQDEARRLFRSPVARVEHLGTYACREIAAYPGWVSEHSYANAIDLARFVLKSGKAVDVLRDFDAGAGAPRRPEGAFLRAVSRRAHDEDVFSHVLTPFFDAGHKNHFHLDLSRFRSDGTRPAAPEPGEPL